MPTNGERPDGAPDFPWQLITSHVTNGIVFHKAFVNAVHGLEAHDLGVGGKRGLGACET
jgi:hypothetical protein